MAYKREKKARTVKGRMKLKIEDKVKKRIKPLIADKAKDLL